MTNVYDLEAERRAAIQAVTALRREFDTTTAAGAKAFAADPNAQAALARLDASKSAAGMRTAAQDLEFINQIDTGNVKPNQVTKQLNAPSQQYFAQVTQTYTDPSTVPTWKPPKRITPTDITTQAKSGIDLTGARYDWVWSVDPKNNKGTWAIGLIGSKLLPPQQEFQRGVNDPAEYGFKWFASDSITANQWATFLNQNDPMATKRNPLGINVDITALAEALPDIKYTQLQEIIYRLTLENDTDITIEDILDKYDDLFGKGK